jgi:hypothetical protein
MDFEWSEEQREEMKFVLSETQKKVKKLEYATVSLRRRTKRTSGELFRKCCQKYSSSDFSAPPLPLPLPTNSH